MLEDNPWVNNTLFDKIKNGNRIYSKPNEMNVEVGTQFLQNKFQYDLECAIVCSVFRYYSSINKTRVTIDDSLIGPNRLNQDNILSKLMTTDIGNDLADIDYTMLKIWNIYNTEKSDYVTYFKSCKSDFIFEVVSYDLDNECESCDGLTSSSIELRPMSLKYFKKILRKNGA